MHRDVKPSNILLTSSVFAYLVDFGIAASDDAGPSLTATGNTVGTFGYMAPERFDGRPADARADIYSLGCVLHEMLTGSRPFADQSSTPSLIRAHLMLDPSPPSSSGAPVPPTLDHAVLCALAKAPEHRYASATEFADALRASVAIPSPRQATITSFAVNSTPQAYIPTGRAPQAPTPTPEPPHARSGGARKAALVGAAITLLGIGVGTGVAVSNSEPEPVSSSPTATAPSPTSSRPRLTGLLGGSQQDVEPVAFGQAQQPREGITATAGAPVPYIASSTAASAASAERLASVDVTLTNNTDRYINFGEQFSSKLEIDDAWTLPVLDIANNAGAGPRLEAVAPGASTTFTVVWALPASPVPITLQLSPLSFRGGGGQPVSWTGEA